MREAKAEFGSLGLWLTFLTFFTLVASLTWSKQTWGYSFRRPPVLSEVRQLKSVSAVVPFKTRPGQDGKLTAEPDRLYQLHDQLAFGRRNPYNGPTARVLLDLDGRGLLPSAVDDDITIFADVHRRLNESGVLAASNDGYNSSKGLRGVIIDGLRDDGQRLVIVAARGGEVSNDHYPYYELAYGTVGERAQLGYLNGQRFFYDLAGMEGFEWYIMWLVLGPPALLVGTCAWFILWAVRAVIRRFRH